MLDRGLAVVANTDREGFDFFRPTDDLQRLDEVNFWRPHAQQHFRALDVGEPFFLRLKHPINAVAGFGFFAVQSFMSVAMAWEVFGDRNGDASHQHFLARVARLRGLPTGDIHELSRQTLSCLVLREVTFLPERLWIPWGTAEGWPKHTVAYKTVDLTAGAGLQLAALLRQVPLESVSDLLPAFAPLALDEREIGSRAVIDRSGQGTFRTRLLDAYDRRCALTNERALPTLDAAHIQPYLGPASNHIQNGLLLRADLHRLYDAGYVTVTPDLQLEVSRRLREDFENGKLYYAMAGQRVRVPEVSALQPSTAALLWHAEHVFR